MNNINDIYITAVKDFPDDIILFLSGKINLDKLDKGDKEEMKKIAWIKIKK